ncbi:MAG: hypothetical protein HY336_00680 [Candidatus Doudnabacteria bacterium]|nr:hypothetical protein [Candidatus Doudnabacteria bacterium]
MLLYHPVGIICGNCDKIFKSGEISVRADGGVLLTGTCPDCKEPQWLETDVRELVESRRNLLWPYAEEFDLDCFPLKGKPQ